MKWSVLELYWYRARSITVQIKRMLELSGQTSYLNMRQGEIDRRSFTEFKGGEEHELTDDSSKHIASDSFG